MATCLNADCDQWKKWLDVVKQFPVSTALRLMGLDLITLLSTQHKRNSTDVLTERYSICNYFTDPAISHDFAALVTEQPIRILSH